MSSNVDQAILVTQTKLRDLQNVTRLALFDANGNPISLGAASAGSAGLVKQAANVAPITTANATDLATAQALANQLKTTVNDLLTKLDTAGITA